MPELLVDHIEERMKIAVAQVRVDPSVVGTRMAAVMLEHGHVVTARTGQRWRDRAIAHLAAA
ncbi:hypothetical protein [Pengzhenrongella sp.]|uniref:hypothetical protein n=1 Tax=Pengzhenrongella sp. TaxID=2888820 RepID=UPI002F91CDE6